MYGPFLHMYRITKSHLTLPAKDEAIEKVLRKAMQKPVVRGGEGRGEERNYY